MLVNLYYRFNFIGLLFILTIVYLTKIIFLDSLFQFTKNIAGWNKFELMYLLYTMILSLLMTDIFGTSVLKFFQKIYYGEGDIYFTKPISIFYYIFFAWANTSNFIPLIIMAVSGGYYFYDVIRETTNLFIFLYLFSLTLGVLINVLLIGNLCSLTFIVKKQVPVDFLFSEISKIMILPFDFFSKKVGVYLLLIIPSIFSAAIPSAIILKHEYPLLVLQVITSIVSVVCFYLFYHYCLKRYEGVGG